MLLLPEGQTGEARERSKSYDLSEIGENCVEELISLFFVFLELLDIETHSGVDKCPVDPAARWWCVCVGGGGAYGAKMFLWDFCRCSLSFDGKQYSDIGRSELLAGIKNCQMILSGIVLMNPDSRLAASR
jgi:hypothetical protein